MINPFLFNTVPPEDFTKTNHKDLLNTLYLALSKVRENLDFTEKFIAELALELFIERTALEDSCSYSEDKIGRLPEYWRMKARKQIEGKSEHL